MTALWSAFAVLALTYASSDDFVVLRILSNDSAASSGLDHDSLAFSFTVSLFQSSR